MTEDRNRLPKGLPAPPACAGHADRQRKATRQAGWRWVKLGEVCEIEMGQSPAGSSYNSNGQGVPLLNGPTEFGPRHPVAVQWTKEPTKFARVGDILFCVRGATTGRKNVADREYCIGRGLAAIRGRDGLANTDFVWHTLDVVTEAMLGKAAGSTFINLPGNELEAFPIPLPPLPEQKRIAAVLNAQTAAVERARKSAEERMAAVNALPSAYLRAVFPAADQPLPKGWRWVKLGEACKFKHGSTPSKANAAYWNGCVPWVSPKDMYVTTIVTSQDKISELAIRETRTALAPMGSVLMVIRSGVLAHSLPVAFVGEPVTFNQDIKAIIPKADVLSGEFLCWTLRMREESMLLDGIKQGATVHSIKSGYVESLSIPLPPVNEQRRIVAILNEQMAAVERARKTAEEELASINALPAALLRRAFAPACAEAASAGRGEP